MRCFATRTAFAKSFRRHNVHWGDVMIDESRKPPPKKNHSCLPPPRAPDRSPRQRIANWRDTVEL